VGGGARNEARGSYATVPGGRSNKARGDYSFAAGQNARVQRAHSGTFAWSDSGNLATDSLLSTGANQFLIRAKGGVGIGTNAPVSQFHVSRELGGSAAAANHVAVLENTAASDGDVLALYTGASTPGAAENFITFKSAVANIGAIEGNGSGGIRLNTSGAAHGPMTGGAFQVQGSVGQPAVRISGDGAPVYLGAGFWYAVRNVAVTLPVELTAFTAERDANAIRLTGQTASETNNAGFEVQRSLEGLWETLDFVPGRGTTSSPQTYRFTDDRLPFTATEGLYRLRQVDTDGTATLSEEVRIARGAPDRLILHGNFPNPFADQTTLRYELLEPATVQLVVYDALWRPVRGLVNAQQSSGRKEISVNASGWSSGLYFVRLIANDQVRTQRLTVLR